MTKIEKLLIHSNNVYTTQDLAVIWEISDKTKLWNIIRHYLRVNKLTRIHKGIYALTPTTSVKPYTSFELGQKLITPSYISFYTALAKHGIISQYYENIHLAALISKSLQIDNQTFVYHKIKNSVFYDPTGIKDQTTYQIADPERAICDSLYLFPNLAFDNLDSIDTQKLSQIATIYHNKRLIQSVKKLIKITQK